MALHTRKSNSGKNWTRTDGTSYGTDDCGVRRRILPPTSIWTWVIRISLITIAFVIVAFASILFGSLNSLRGRATAVRDGASSFLSAAKTGDKQKLENSAQNVSKAAHGIHDDLDTSMWEFISRLPVVGSDVDSVRTLADILVDFSDHALIPMSKSGKILALSEFVHDDSIDASVLPSLLYAVDEATPALTRASRVMEELPPAKFGPTKSIIDSTRDTIITVSNITKRLRPLFPYLSGLLGANGQTKNYLILAENTAEIHASGGFVGSFAILSVTNGKIEVGKFSNLAEVLSFLEYPAGATEEEIETFGQRCDTSHGDHNVLPDFTRVGQLYHNIWGFYQDAEIDGVFGLDPVFLQYLLEAIGGIDTSFGVRVDGSNAAAIMLNQSLFWWDPVKCDDFYREVANKTLSKIFGDLESMDLSAFLSAVSKAADEGRCLVWVRDEIIEEALKEADFAGELAHDSAKPEVGVYVSDGSTSKMSFYLGMETELSEPQHNSDGSHSYRMTVTLKNNFDPSAYKQSIPGYIKVLMPGRDDYDLYEEFHLIAPEGGRIENVELERLNTRGDPPGDSEWKNSKYQGLDVWGANLRLTAQESAVITCTVVTSPDVSEPITVRRTPLMPPQIAYWNTSIKPGE